MGIKALLFLAAISACVLLAVATSTVEQDQDLETAQQFYGGYGRGYGGYGGYGRGYGGYGGYGGGYGRGYGGYGRGYGGYGGYGRGGYGRGGYGYGK